MKNSEQREFGGCIKAAIAWKKSQKNSRRYRGRSKQASVTISCGSDERSLIVARMERGKAESMWAAMNALKLAGLPIEMPHIYAETETSGFLLLQIPEAGAFPAPEAISRKAGPGTMKVVEAYFPEELKKIFSLYRMLKPQPES